MSATPGADKPTRVRELLASASDWLAAQGVPDARLDTELLLAHVLGIARLGLYLDHDRPLTVPERDRFRGLMRRRGAEREPVAYLVGKRGFHGIELEVGPGCLVPRPETEHLVELALEELAARAKSGLRVVDVGTGSGCIALAVAAAAPTARVTGVDRSPAALGWALKNARRLAPADLASGRVSFVRGDLLGPLAPGSVDLVLSNPPYITPDEVPALAPDVIRHEPREALVDQGGLPLTAALARAARAALVPGGLVAIETGAGKAELVERHLLAAGFVEPRRVKDLSDLERIVAARVPPP